MTITWTPDRPTKPGEYWLSIEPKKRPSEQRPYVMFPDVVPFVLYGGGQGSYREGGSMLDLSDPWFDGAQWARRETPEDPFKEPTPNDGLVDLRKLKAGTELEITGLLSWCGGTINAIGERMTLRIPDDDSEDGRRVGLAWIAMDRMTPWALGCTRCNPCAW